MLDLEKTIEKCLSPIEGESLVGQDIKYDVDFGRVKNEIQKVGEKDWKEISGICIHLLSGKSKDLNLAGFLTLGLFRQSGYAGLAAGFKIVNGILTEFEGGYFPKRKNEKKTEKVRQASIEWLSHPERLVGFVEATSPEIGEAADVIKSYDELKKLKNTVEDIFSPPGPSLSRLLTAVGTHKAKYSAEIEKKETGEENGRKENVETIKQPKEFEKTDSVLEEKKEEKKGSDEESSGKIALPSDPYKALITTANALREIDPANPVSYRIMRIAKWDKIDSPPTAKPKALLSREMNSAKGAFNSPDPLVAIISSERSFASYGLWWLDLQRAIVMAMKRAGTLYQGAMGAVKDEVTRLIKRFPDLPHMVYSDDTPFADKETRAWLEGLVATDEMDPIRTSIAVSDEDLEKDLQKAKEMAKNKDLPGALNFLQKKIDTCTFKRDAFRCRLLGGQLCLKDEKILEAKLIFEDLYRFARKNRLDDWEPPLFLELAVGLEKLYKRDKKSAATDKRKEIQELILRYDLGFSFGQDGIA